jgi:NADPH2:quinone reductase
MQAASIEKVGPPEPIRYGDLPVPALGTGDVLVKVSAVCVNPVDTSIRSGQFPMDLPFPFVVGRDMAGVVQAVGPAVTLFQPGHRVWCNNQGYYGRQGTFAEYIAVDQGLLYPLPAGVDDREADRDQVCWTRVFCWRPVGATPPSWRRFVRRFGRDCRII